MSEKLSRLLEAKLKKLATEDPSARVSLVITPRSQEDVEAVVQEIESAGGTAIETGPETVYCQLPSDQVQQLAGSDLISEIRPSRIHKMH